MHQLSATTRTDWSAGSIFARITLHSAHAIGSLPSTTALREYFRLTSNSGS
jgi:hypothetical protein